MREYRLVGFLRRLNRQVGGYPRYAGEPVKDSDRDGMPDEWETTYGLDPNDPSDAAKDCNGDGYMNIEKYINGLDPTKTVDWKDLRNNRVVEEEAPPPSPGSLRRGGRRHLRW